MGPYCKFCQMRCFVPMPKGTPDYILTAYGSSTIVATCQHGQAFEKQKTGYCYDDIKDAIAALEQARSKGYSVGLADEQRLREDVVEQARQEGFAAGDYEGRRRLVYALTDCGRLAPAHYREWAEKTAERLGYRDSALENQLDRLASLVELVRKRDEIPDAYQRWLEQARQEGRLEGHKLFPSEMRLAEREGARKERERCAQIAESWGTGTNHAALVGAAIASRIRSEADE